MMKPGFTTLFAVLVASLLLAVGFAIFDITYKESSFSIVSRNSNFAIYAADAGLECAYYWDHKYSGSFNFSLTSHTIFATSSDSNPPPAKSGINCGTFDITTLPPPSQDLGNYPECLGTSVSSWCVCIGGTSGTCPSVPQTATTTFAIKFPPVIVNKMLTPVPYCAVVQVVKSGIQPVTTITSRGYNTCTPNDPNRVERALQQSY